MAICALFTSCLAIQYFVPYNGYKLVLEQKKTVERKNIDTFILIDELVPTKHARCGTLTFHT